METGIRILLLTALLAALPGCASVRDWFHQRAERRAERRAAEAQRTEPRESEPPQDESAPPRVIEPEVSRRKITVPRIRTSNVELGLDVRAPDARHGDLAPRDLRLDDAGWRALILGGLALAGLRALRLGGAPLGAALGALVKPVAHRGAAGERGQQRRQKKNANPSFHSSASSFRLRLVRIQCALNSPRTKKRRAR